MYWKNDPHNVEERQASLFHFTAPATFTMPAKDWFVSFEDIAQRLLLTRDPADQSYLFRWLQNNEALEIVLDDFLRNEIKGKIDTVQAFNQLLNGLIVFLEGGDPAPYLSEDPADLLAQYNEELDLYFNPHGL